MNHSRNKIISFIIIITFLFISSCNNDSPTEPKLVVDQKLVGTWELTKIITSIGSQDVELTPEAAGISSTVTFNSSLTFHSTSTDADGVTTQDTGTWGTLNGELTIKITDGNTMKGAYKFLDNGNVTIDRKIKIKDSEIFATLVYSKKNME